MIIALRRAYEVPADVVGRFLANFAERFTSRAERPEGREMGWSECIEKLYSVPIEAMIRFED